MGRLEKSEADETVKLRGSQKLDSLSEGPEDGAGVGDGESDGHSDAERR